MCHREICRHLPVDLIAHAYRYLIQIPKYVKHCKRHIRRALHPASILRSNTVEPSHPPWTSGSRSELAAVASAASQFIRFLSEDLTYERAGSYRAGISLAYCDHLLDLIRRDSCPDCPVGCQCRGRGHHRIDPVIRILKRSKLSLKKNLLPLFQRIVEIERRIAYIRFYHPLIFLKLIIKLIRINRRLMIQMLKQHVLLCRDPYYLLP